MEYVHRVLALVRINITQYRAYRYQREFRPDYARCHRYLRNTLIFLFTMLLVGWAAFAVGMFNLGWRKALLDNRLVYSSTIHFWRLMRNRDHFLGQTYDYYLTLVFWIIFLLPGIFGVIEGFPGQRLSMTLFGVFSFVLALVYGALADESHPTLWSTSVIALIFCLLSILHTCAMWGMERQEEERLRREALALRHFQRGHVHRRYR